MFLSFGIPNLQTSVSRMVKEFARLLEGLYLMYTCNVLFISNQIAKGLTLKIVQKKATAKNFS